MPITIGFRRWRATRRVARRPSRSSSDIGVDGAFLLPTSESGFVEGNAAPVSCLEGGDAWLELASVLLVVLAAARGRIVETSSLCIRIPARMSHPEKRYFPNDLCSHLLGARRTANKGV